MNWTLLDRVKGSHILEGLEFLVYSLDSHSGDIDHCYEYGFERLAIGKLPGMYVRPVHTGLCYLGPPHHDPL
jgi:hypothetical protein